MKTGCDRLPPNATTARGFSVVEVVLAGAVLAITALGFSASLAQSGQQAQGVRDELLARRALRSMMVDLEGMPVQSMLALDDTTFDIPELTRVDPGTAPGSIAIEDGPSGAEGVYRVTLRAVWLCGGRTKTVESVRLLAPVYS